MATISVTGANGFIGKNLVVHLKEAGHTVVSISHKNNSAEIAKQMEGSTLVIHLAGVNRAEDEREFETANVGFTEVLINAMHSLGTPMRMVFASSIHAARKNPYGRSKRAAEIALERFGNATGTPVYICRLPNVFGKWCKANYNSVVATFCYNLSRGLPITVDSKADELRLTYIDDVIDIFLDVISDLNRPSGSVPVGPVYEITVGELAKQLTAIRDSRDTLSCGAVGKGLLRALYSTYASYQDPENFKYPLVVKSDPRGSFVEVFRTPESGQFSYFSAHPGVTRGGHYHHSKVEKFLVLHGKARFKFRNLLTNEIYEIETSDIHAEIVETSPGWSHSVTNIGTSTMVVLLWANELFDHERPDTFSDKA